MQVHLFTGSLSLVCKSGVGQAVLHQKAMLQRAGVDVTETWDEPADIVHINTVLPDSVFAALRARRRGEMVVYYGHSTMQDFRNSFVGSNLLAPLFRRWLCFCYRLGDIILTPTPYSKEILEGYSLNRPIYAISNGVDTDFFAPDSAHGAAFRKKYGLAETDKVVVSAGHYMERKGLLEYIELARALPEAKFYWFGFTPAALVPQNIRQAMADAPSNLTFAGYISQAELRDAYCGADLFAFYSHEETEGIVVLEALACGVPALVSDIPVYKDWLHDGVNVYKAASSSELQSKASAILHGALPPLREGGLAVARARSMAAMGKTLCGIYRKAAEQPSRSRHSRVSPLGSSFAAR